MDRVKNILEIFGGIFESQQAAEDFMKIVDGKPKRFMEELYLQGDCAEHIEVKSFEKSQIRQKNYLKIFLTVKKSLKH